MNENLEIEKSVLPKEVLDLKDVIVNEMAAAVGSGEFEIVDCPLKHTFTKGLYGRKIFMKKGVSIVSKIHKTEHQFAILKGKVLVRTYEGEKFTETIYQAGDSGITKPGTLRILQIIKDCIWMTFHATEKQTVEEVEEDIIEYEEPFVNKINNLLK